MKNSKVGFLTPANKLVWLEYSLVNEFCKRVCEHDKNRERFEVFKQNYSYFDPYFDFVMFELEFIMINGLCNNSCIAKYGDALYEISDSQNLEDYNYKQLKSNGSNNHSLLPIMTNCSDSELKIHSFSDDNIETCMINKEGICMMSHSGLLDSDYERGSHDLTCRKVLNQLLSRSKNILEDYLVFEDTDFNYLINRFGFVKSTSKEDCAFIIGNSNTMNPSHYQVLSSLEGFTFRDTANRHR